MKRGNISFKLILGLITVILLTGRAGYSAWAEVVYFSDDFESGLGEWDVSGYDWDLTESDSRSATHSATDSPDGNYQPNANTALTLAHPIDLTGSVSPVLSFWYKIYMPDCSYIDPYGGSRDYGYVEISANGGLSWTPVKVYQCLNIPTWTPELIDLSSYKASSVLIRFRLIADGEGDIGDGWYIDDLEIKEKETERLPFPFSDNFENGLCHWEVSGYDWDLTESDSRSVTHSATDSPNGDYQPNANTALTLAYPIDLTGSVSPVLSFWYKISMPDCSYIDRYGGSRDYGYVEVSADGGLSWTAVKVYNCLNIPTWTPELIDLSSYKASSVLVRFRLIADGEGDIGDGWYIDDLEIKELGQKLYYCDSDDDGYVSSQPSGSCTGANCAPVECEITAGDDCDDSDGTVNPGSAEGCGNNEGGICGCSDCNSECTDSDGDGYSPDGGNCGAVDCNDDDGAVNPGATEGPVGDPTCSDGKDNNCDGKTDVADTQCTIVCVPSDEICDGLDNDCDGQVDEGVKNTYYKDADGDGYGDLADTVLSCAVPPGYVLDDTDCDDSDAQAYPGADEVCDGLDNDCDGSSDEDLTCDDPDLIVTYVGNVPAGKKRGGKFTIKERVTNEGGYAGSSSIVRYYLSKNKTRDSKDKRLKASRGGRLVSALAGGESSSGKVKLAIPEKTKPGRYYVLVCADDRDNVSESDESNNCKRSRKRIRIKK